MTILAGTPFTAALQDLEDHHPLTSAQCLRYREQGFIKLNEVLSPATLAACGDAISAEVARRSRDVRPMASRSTYEKAFLQVMNLWRDDATARAFTFSRKLARLAAELMGVEGVRLYHDQALYKEPAGGITPWHCDQQYWPLATDHTITVWVPLQAVPLSMGPLAFSVGSHNTDFGRALEISDDSEREVARRLTLADLPVDEGAFDLGEVSFHSGWTFHRAGVNRSAQMRAVMTVIYFADGTRLAQPANRNQQRDRDTWMPGARVGEPVATELNPLLWSR
ncbi:MAG TPA: phytanoyl-CoA dioxygenase family protein [Planctomycetota bacterium]|jgi:ectoine hydroxylase-related dioxygenase (phytanoyl-CoA dioxygenase family)|nr:phytanoyl-CoA dioxygenase family protein [Planctomycetota bacterium]